MFDREMLADLIEGGRVRQAPSLEIADAILAQLGDRRWAKAFGHPTRIEILRLLRDNGPLSPVKAAELIDGATLGTLAYHFRTLNDLGLIKLADTVARRGATEHIYALAETTG